MEGIKETKNHIKSIITVAMSVQGSLIDFETTGIPGRDEEHEVICLGYFSGNRIVIIQRKTKERVAFYSEVKEVLKALPRPFYSYNSKFEQDVMEKELGMQAQAYDFVDIMKPWREKAERAGIKWPRLDDLISEPEDYFGEGKISGKDVPGLWKAYLAGATERLLKMIMEHCLSDILREAILLIRYSPPSPLE
jgi:hypothetical protein